MDKIRDSASAASRTIGSSFSRSSKAYNVDDELIAQFSDNVKVAIAAFQFLTAQTARIAEKNWPRFFKSSRKVILLWMELLGEEALQFEELDAFYTKFDEMQISSEGIFVHPKERNFVVPSVQLELANYLAVVNHLESTILQQAKYHSEQLSLRVAAIVAQLKACRKNIKTRDQLGKQAAKLEKKARHLAEKGTSLDVQKRAELAGYEASLDITKAAYDAESSNLKVVLPEFLALVEEFTEVVTKWTADFHVQQVKEVQHAFEYINVFHGFATSAEGNDYESIIDQWEKDATTTRVQLESLLQTIYDKNPDRLNEEIDDKDSSLKASKLWSLVTQKLKNKQHTVKAKDLQNGIFNPDMMADPLVSYEKYQDPRSNLAENYHPTQIIDEEDIVVPAKLPQSPPALPPRDPMREILISPRPGVQSPVFRNEFDHFGAGLRRSNSLASVSSVGSLSELIPHYSSSDESDAQSMAASQLPDGGKPERSTQQLVKQYNMAKNDIRECPTLPSKFDLIDVLRGEVCDLQEKNSVSYSMHEMYVFFEKVLALSNKSDAKVKSVVASQSFSGVNPGDLSFQSGESIQVLLNLQDYATTFSDTKDYWLVGGIETEGVHRVGFVPSTHVEI